MARLTFVSHQNQWVDLSLRSLTSDWLRRIEERFAGVNGGGQVPSILQSFASLNQTHAFIEEFFEKYPAGMTHLVSAEDKAYFLVIAQRPGQKPVPFIPILDASFEVWFKKVRHSPLYIMDYFVILTPLRILYGKPLWEAKDVGAVFDQGPQRVCILRGPVAAAHSKVKDEPIKDVFSDITKDLIERLLDRYYGGDASEVPTVDYLAPPPIPPTTFVESINAKESLVFHAPSPVPDTGLWLDNLASPHLSWLRVLTSSTIVRGSSCVDNPIRRLLAPRNGQKVLVHLKGAIPTGVEVFGSIRSYRTQKADFKAVQIKYTPGTKVLNITVFEERRGAAIPLSMKFTCVPSVGSVPIHEVADRRNPRIKWFGDNETLPYIERPSMVPRLPLPQRTWRLSAMWLVTRARHSRPRGTRGCRHRWILASSPDGRYVHIIPGTRDSHPDQT